MNAIEIKNLTVAYGENIALEDFNLDVEIGSLMALVGPNGAGKSTLIKTILKFLKQYSNMQSPMLFQCGYLHFTL